MRRFRQVVRDKRLWRLLILAALALAVSTLLVVGGAAGLAWTNTEQFCTGCHAMRDNVYAEFKGSIHDVNRSGVRAVCSDCHVPREPVALIKRKFAASWELFHALRGTIDTREKFEARRYQMALNVWQRMKDTDSQECRNCHHRDAMSAELQTARAQKRHAKAARTGETCIDCHFGIAHQEPDGPLAPRDLQPGQPTPRADGPAPAADAEPDAAHAGADETAAGTD
jgi:cytochrome c-type protein NapC